MDPISNHRIGYIKAPEVEEVLIGDETGQEVTVTPLRTEDYI